MWSMSVSALALEGARNECKDKLEANISSTIIVARRLDARVRSPHVHYVVGWAKGAHMDRRKRLVASEAVRRPPMMRIPI